MTINLSDPAIRARLDNPFKRYKGPKKIKYFADPQKRGRPTKDENRKVARRQRRSKITKGVGFKINEGRNIITQESYYVFSECMFTTMRRERLRRLDMYILLSAYCHHNNRTEMFSVTRYINPRVIPSHGLRDVVIHNLTQREYLTKITKGWYRFTEQSIDMLEGFWRQYDRNLKEHMEDWVRMETWNLKPEHAPKSKAKPKINKPKKKWVARERDPESIAYKLEHDPL